MIVNGSNEDVYLGLGQNAYNTYGVLLKANGGAFVDEPDSENWIFTGPYYGICASGSKVISVTELSTSRKRTNGFHI